MEYCGKLWKKDGNVKYLYGLKYFIQKKTFFENLSPKYGRY